MRTGTRAGAQTDDDLYLYLYGDVCSLIGTYLDHPNCNDFESGHTDRFTFNKRSVGNVSRSVLMQFLCPKKNLTKVSWGRGGRGGGGERGQIDVK